MATPTSVEAYLAALPDERRAALERLRKVLAAAIPGGVEAISWQMPSFKHRGRALVCYAAFADHYSLFPMSGEVIEAVGDELKPYVSGRGTIRFRYDERFPVALVKRVVKARLAEVEARGRR